MQYIRVAYDIKPDHLMELITREWDIYNFFYKKVSFFAKKSFVTFLLFFYCLKTFICAIYSLFLPGFSTSSDISAMFWGIL